MTLSRLLRSPGSALFALLLGPYVYFYQGGGWGQNVRFDLVRSLVERHTLRIDAYRRNTGDRARYEGHYYSDKAPGVSWLAVPAYATVLAALGTSEPEPAALAAAYQIATAWAIALPSALAAVALWVLLVRLGLARASAAGLVLAYGLGTLAFPYSTMLVGHQLAAAMLAVAFVRLCTMRHALAAAPPAGGLFVTGGLLGCAVAVEYQSALVLVVLLVYAAGFVRPWARLSWIAAGLAPPLLAVAAYHAAAFGGPLNIGYHFSSQEHRGQGFFMGLGVPQLHALRAILFSTSRGLFFSSPWLMLAVPGVVRLLRQARFRPEGRVCLAVVLLFLWMNASLVDWEGGWVVGPRYLVPSLPFWMLAVAGLALDSSGRPLLSRLPVVLTVAFSIAMMLVATAVKPEVTQAVERPFQDLLLPSFFSGSLAISTQSIDERAPVDGPRQAWNLGECLGLTRLASLIPLALYAGLAGIWLVRTLRRPHAAATPTA